jgi:hypothetical protein
MGLRKAVGKNFVPALVITVLYEVAYPLLRPLAITAVRAARTKVTKITTASERSLPLSEKPAPAVEEAAPPAQSAPEDAKPVRKGSRASATRTK